MGELIYLDNAATSFPKPVSVYHEVRRCIEEYCGNPGRSGHSLSLAAAKTVYECRQELAALFECENTENVIFTLNTTHSLNMALKGLMSDNDHVLISNIEHNSVYRPVMASGCKFDIFNSYQPKEKLLKEISEKLRADTKMIICSHASNISPICNPIKEIGAMAKRRGIYFIVDAAQSAGIHPISMKKSNIDALCIPAHKGLYGIQGCGALLLSSKFEGDKGERIKCLTEGGNGVASFEPFMPKRLPERLESGTLPTPAIAGLLAGIRAVKETGTDNIRAHEYLLCKRLRENLKSLRGVKLYCPEFSKTNIILFNLLSKSSIETTELLDREGVCVRGGFHCSPLAHKLLKTGENGAVRVSPGGFNTLEEIDRFTDILYKINRL